MLQQAVKDIALERPGATAIFCKHRIDFCCNGGRSLAEAAARRGLDPHGPEREIEALSAPPIETIPDQPKDLIAFILRRFHETHRRELPELVRLARRVEAVHRDHAACPHELAAFLRKRRRSLRII
jgi:regulator of cell morphogenesis and NO signaling